jgi:two-component system cell cycle sensor histidine kinase/response regulator CckA
VAFPVDGRAFAGTLDPRRSYARIRITDSGIGMSPEVLKRVFDPFFTTKERGHGTGLGLSVVHGIVMSHEGACLIASSPGAGTMVAIYLPLSDGARTEVQKVVPAPQTSPRGRERVMIVDDEIDITDSLTIGLERLGYKAVAVNDPKKALAAFAKDPSAWDVVVSDQSMPSMTGRSLFAQLKALRSPLRFILFTGLSDSASEQAAFADGIDAFLVKPVSVEQLALLIRQLLDAPPERARASTASVSRS